MSRDDINARSPWRARAIRRHGSQERRDALQKIAEKVEAGTLIIRQATAEERELYGIRTPTSEVDDAIS